jgi:hypothetical protein
LAGGAVDQEVGETGRLGVDFADVGAGLNVLARESGKAGEG